ncbi:MAG: hypothetical protein LW875_00810 [Proteobacteria bacterium]|nr:hypothetical protein [Pseudomonadota bacterium]
MSQRIHFLGVTEDPSERKRFTEICSEFHYHLALKATVDELLDDNSHFESVPFVVVSAVRVAKKEDIVGYVQVAKQSCPDAFLVVIVNKRIPQEITEFVKKSGTNLVMLENELLETSKLEFIASQIIRASYVPVKASEFKKDSQLPFHVYGLMPLNQKFVPVVPKGSPFTDSRRAKVEALGDLYVKREDIDQYRAYVMANTDASAAGLKSRCRAQYLNFCSSHTDLVFLLSDQSEIGSFQQGKALFEKCQGLAKDLLVSLSSVGEAWEVVNTSSIGEFGSVERSPSLAAYSGLLSLMSNVGDSTDVMTAALICDIGLIDLSPKLSAHLRQVGSADQMNEEQQAEYHQHPAVSLNRCLSRKLPLADKLKNIVMCTHERSDGKGYPHKVPGEKVPLESFLIQFSEKVDQTAMPKMGQARVSPLEARKKALEEGQKEMNQFPFLFLEKIKSAL